MDAASNVAEQFGVYWPNLIAQIVLFFIVYWVLSKFAFKPIMAMLEERRRRIEEGQINAEKIKQQLVEAQAKYEETLARANAEAQRLIEEVKASGEKLAEEKRQAALAEAQEIIRRTHDSLTLERERTLAELKKEVGRLVAEPTKKVTKKFLPRHFGEVLKDYQRLLRLEVAKHHAVVESASALNSNLSSLLVTKLKARYGDDLTIEFKTNPTLLGGLRVKLGDDVWAGSVRIGFRPSKD